MRSRRFKSHYAAHVPEGVSVRRIPPNRRSITGHVPSKKKPGMLAFESKLERGLYLLLEFDPFVKTVLEQPVRIAFRTRRGKIEEYTPDCLITYYDERRKPALIEVKYRRELFAQWREFHPKFRAAARYANRIGKTFRILTECEIHGPRLENATWLISYRSLPLPPAEIAMVLEALRNLPSKSTPHDLLSVLSESQERREAFLVVLWHCMANGWVAFDMDTALSMSSPIWVVPE